jgi:O-acetylserine/cysteine efflux transporter
MTDLPPRHLAFLMLINAIWAGNLVASKIGVAQFPPILFCALRFSALGLVLVPFLRWHPGIMQRLLVAAMLSGGIQYAVMFVGIRMCGNVGAIAIASQLGVPFTTLLSVLFLGEVVHWRRGLGIVLAFAGVLVIALKSGLPADRAGLALIVVSALVGACGIVAVKSLGTRLDALEMQAWFAVSGLPALWLLTAALEDGQWQAMRSAAPSAWAALGYTAFVSSLVGHTGYYWLVRRHPVTSLAPLTTLYPVLGVVLGAVAYGEALSTALLLGGALTVGGVFIIVRRERRIADTGT